MSKFDADYYFIRKAETGTLPFLVPDEYTEDRRFRFEPQPPDSPPLVFHNGWKENFEARGIVSPVPDILFAGSDMVVRSRIRDTLLPHAIPDLHFHPVIYVDDQGSRHADYWYMTFTERFDCWDRATSEFDEDEPPIRLGGFELHEVFTYSLDETLLDELPLAKRLLFKMGGDLRGFVVCHRSLAEVFRGGDGRGTRLQGIAEF